MVRDNTNRIIMWAAVITLALGVLGFAVQASLAAGSLQTQVLVLEKQQHQYIRRDQWEEFSRDVRERLDRIEKKIDEQGQEKK